MFRMFLGSIYTYLEFVVVIRCFKSLFNPGEPGSRRNRKTRRVGGCGCGRFVFWECSFPGSKLIYIPYNYVYIYIIYIHTYIYICTHLYPSGMSTSIRGVITRPLWNWKVLFHIESESFMVCLWWPPFSCYYQTNPDRKCSKADVCVTRCLEVGVWSLFQPGVNTLNSLTWKQILVFWRGAYCFGGETYRNMWREYVDVWSVW